MSDLVLAHDRKAAVSEALGLSFARVQALRRLAAEPLTLRALAERLAADPPYVTLIVDDLEQRGLVERRPHPEDRRAKLVRLTRAGRAAAARPTRSSTSRPPRCATRRPRTSPRCCACSSASPAQSGNGTFSSYLRVGSAHSASWGDTGRFTRAG